ncbi:MAG TPA: TVP38/TMEM64 family protein [Pirellulales bacterium]|nr:TVP38/TMEM64 family protein [Pirellulales bacterium]
MTERTTKLTLMSALLVAAALAALMSSLPVGRHLQAFADAVRAAGAWGPVLLGAAHVLATLLFIPAWPLTLLAGFLFGLVRGTVTIWVASAIGASAAFWLGRSGARDWVQHRLSSRFQAIDTAVDRQGFKIVLLIRLSPIFPSVFTNYAMSLTAIRFRDFLVASSVGMLPGIFVYVYFGSTAHDLAEITTGSYRSGQNALLLLGLMATIVTTTIVTRVARAALRDAAGVTPLAGEARATHIGPSCR